MLTKKILIIEDNLLNMELVKELLESAGYNALQALDAETGMELARSERPALILMDIRLPGIDGLEATRILKADPATQHIPVVAVTAHAMSGYDQVVREAGCVGYITKPIDTFSFISQIEGYL